MKIILLVSMMLLSVRVQAQQNETFTIVTGSDSTISVEMENDLATYDRLVKEVERLLYFDPRDPRKAEKILRLIPTDRYLPRYKISSYLVQAMAMQGKYKEALDIWREFVIPSDKGGSSLQTEPETRLHYAQVAMKAGASWAESCLAYNKAVELLNGKRRSDGPLLPLFTTDVPRPADLRLMTHIALGTVYSHGNTRLVDKTRAIREFEAAKRISPSNPLLHLYYGEALEYQRDYAGAKREYTFVIEKARVPAHRMYASKLLNELSRP